MPNWPEHVGEMSICHNSHKTSYQSAAEWIKDDEHRNFPHVWISKDDKQQAIATDSIWTIQWYPLSPVGFCAVAASTFEDALEFANRRSPVVGRKCE